MEVGSGNKILELVAGVDVELVGKVEVVLDGLLV